ncbi:MAG TPA: hypothetical protein VNL74_07045 [Methylococcus sp.]|nr:hypothetical protein [Methylococcus sp.]
MKEFELGDFLQYLAQYEFKLGPGFIIAVAVFLLLVLAYVFRKRAVHPVSVDETPLSSQKTPATETYYLNLPQDSVLRRHYLSHVRYMIESVTFPRPVDSVLRRHYEQLIAGEMDACLGDEAQMKKLIRRYEEHRRNAMRS